MASKPLEFLEQGCAIVNEVLLPHGFRREKTVSGKASGGEFASTSYVNGSRRLELHFRYSLGLVSYHFGSLAISHEGLMRAVLGAKGGSKYPGFSEVPTDAFQDLAYDLAHFAKSFLNGEESEFSKYVTENEKFETLSGFARLAGREG